MEMYEGIDWRHTTAGSDYEDMVQIAGDYSFDETLTNTRNYRGA